MTNGTSIRIKVSGPWACFSRPEMKVERVSYDVMTPSAARGILDSILWKPEMRWNIRQIEVLNPIRFQALKRNEVQSKTAPATVGKWMEGKADYQPMPAGAGSSEGTPRNTLALRDVAYIIEAEPLVFHRPGENHPKKYVSMMERRVKKGACFFPPAFGCREFAADFSFPDPQQDKPLEESRDLGVMLYDIAFGSKDNRPIFFQARLEDGVLDTRMEEVIPDPDLREELARCSYKR